MENNEISKIDEFILTRILEKYFNWDGLTHYYETRDTIDKVNNMRIFIYSNDHNPPHFHVQTNDRTVDAKFKIENCEYMSGRIKQKQIKKIFKFYNDEVVKIKMDKIWNKKVNESYTDLGDL